MVISQLTTFALSAAEHAQEVIRFKGSDTMGAKLVPLLCEAYKIDHPGTKFEIAAEGSTTAFTALLDATADIGMSLREIEPQELKRFEDLKIQLHKHLAGHDCLIIAVNANNPVSNLSAKQVEGLFTGEIKTWKEVGGNDAPVSLLTRNTASETYKYFSRIAMNSRSYSRDNIKLLGGEHPMLAVAKDVNSITYISHTYAKAKGTKTISINGIAPPADRVNDYPYVRTLYYFVRSDTSPAARTFIDWATRSAKAEAIVRKVGFFAAE